MECVGIDKKQFIKDFERTLNLAKARAYSSVSLERPLSDYEFQEFKNTMELIK